MSRLKTFGKYILLLVAFYIVSNILAYFCIVTTYSPIDKEINESNNISITIKNAKATIVNGKIEGKIKNNSNEQLENKYLKCDLISKRGPLILTKYIEIESIEAGEEKNITVNFRAENINKCVIQVVDEYTEGENTKLINIKNSATDEEKVGTFIAIFILMHYFL